MTVTTLTREGGGFDAYYPATKKRIPKGRRTGGCFHPRRDGLALI